MPSDFLTKRSDPFRMILKNEGKEAISHSISLPETAPQIFEHILFWALSPDPEIDPGLPLLVMVDIAIFATIYLMPALLHQVLDNLRRKVAEPQATLTPELLEHIYSQVDERSLLRYFTQAALATIGRSWPVKKATDQTLESWKQVFERHPTLGYDYFHVQVKGWTSEDLAQGGRCRFHRHLPRQIALITRTNQSACSRVRYECFQDVGDVCNEEKASEKSKENRKVLSDNGVSVDNPVAVQDPEHPVDSLEDGIHHFTLNETGTQGQTDWPRFILRDLNWTFDQSHLTTR